MKNNKIIHRLLVVASFLLVASGCDQSSSPIPPSSSLITKFDTPAEASPDITNNIALTRISPRGEDVTTSKQIVFQFNQPVAALGEMARTARVIPIQFTPALKCSWRWIAEDTLACQLKDDAAILPATKYTISLVKNGGNESTETKLIRYATHNFLFTESLHDGGLLTSQRPTVSSTYFQDWQAPGVLTMAVYFSQPVEKRSIESHLFFETDTKQRVAVTLVPQPGQTEVADSLSVGFIRPMKELPGGSSITLRVEPGLKHPTGAEVGIEARELLVFDTHESPRFLGVRCCVEENTLAAESTTTMECPTQYEGLSSVLLTNGETSQCNPQAPIALVFSSPTTKEEVVKALTISPNIANDRPLTDLTDTFSAYASLDNGHEKGQEYPVYFPNGLSPITNYTVAAGAVIKDIFGRAIENKLETTFATTHRLPRFVVDDSEFVLEKNAATFLPAVVQNINSLTFQYSALTHRGLRSGKSEIPVDNVPNVSYYFPIKIKELLGGSGIIRGTFSSLPHSRNLDNRDSPLTGQVTPFHIEVKYGHFNTLVWVTDLTTGAPVAGAKVSMVLGNANLILSDLANTPVATGTTDELGFAELPGTETLDPSLAVHNSSQRFYVLVHQGEDIGFVPLTWSFQPAGSASNESRFGYLKIWGMTPQGIYKLGDVVDFKLVVRNQDVKQLTPAPRDGYVLDVIDPLGKIVHTEPNVTLSAFGTYASRFTLPKNGSVGMYEFKLTARFAPKTIYPWLSDAEKKKTLGRTFSVMQLLVADFTPSPFKVSTDIAGTIFHPGDAIPVEISAKLHAGGAFIGGTTRIQAKVVARPFEDLAPELAQFFFSSTKSRPSEEDEYEPSTTAFIHSSEGVLDGNGEYKQSFPLPEQAIYYGDLIVEGAVQDDRGKNVTSLASRKFAGPKYFVGGKFQSWMIDVGKEASVQLAVIDDAKKLTAGKSISVTVVRTEATAAQVKSEGNAYLTRYENKDIPVATCTVISDKNPVSCSFTPSAPGLHTIIATVIDDEQRSHETRLSTYAVGLGDLIWKTDDAHSLDLIPESTKLRVGDTAKILVKNPFPGAQALLTVERYGIISKKIITLTSATPIVEVPVTDEMIPGFYVSISIFSPRVDAPLENGGVDLGKPAIRVGSTAITVSEAAKEYTVTVNTERSMYKPGETVSGSVEVSSGENTEVALVVLDEAVFDLIQKGREYFNPAQQLYSLDGLGVNTYDNIVRLLGRRAYQKKGANSGGDGLGSKERDNLKFVAYWNPALSSSAPGKSTFSFTAPDNLTGWRIFAIALNEADKMGLGEHTFSVSKELELRPNMPNQVLEGDSFQGEFTILNRTDSPKEVSVRISASGAVKMAATAPQTVSLKSFERKSVAIPLEADNVGKMTITASATSGELSDQVSNVISVGRKAALESVSLYGSFDKTEAQQSLLFPDKIRTDIGGLNITLSPTVIGGIGGAFDYMKSYPFHCWEQRLSKGILAAHFKTLKAYVPGIEWPESVSIPEATINDAASFQAPNGGMAYYLPEDQYVDPYLSALTAVGFLWLHDEGFTPSNTVDEKLSHYLVNFLKKDASPTFYSSGMSATVRAVALYALAARNKIPPAEVVRYREFVPQMSLFGKSMYYQALLAFPSLKKEQESMKAELLKRSDETGGTLTFQETIDTTSFERILTTPVRDNCAVMESLLKAPLTGGMPMKMVRAITASRKSSASWGNTQENLFCTRALVQYAKTYEKVQPQGEWSVFFNDEKLGSKSFTSVANPPALFQREIRASDQGKAGAVIVNRNAVGKGTMYYQTTLSFAPLELKPEAIVNGIEITREYSIHRHGKYQLITTPQLLQRGDIVRVDLFLSLPAARNFVVLNDPIPGGFEPVNTELKTASTFDATGAESPLDGGSYWFRFNDWIDFASSRWSFYHRELRHDAARFYSEYLPPGNYHLSYAVQAIAPGSFTILPAKAEEMYSPGTFGQTEPGKLVVQ